MSNDKVDRSREHIDQGLTLLKIVFIIILGITIIKVLLGLDQTITFKSLLDFISDVPQVNMNDFMVFDDLRITADWGVFNFLRTFINLFTLPLGITVFIGGAIYQVITFLIYFIQFVF